MRLEEGLVGRDWGRLVSGFRTATRSSNGESTSADVFLRLPIAYGGKRRDKTVPSC